MRKITNSKILLSFIFTVILGVSAFVGSLFFNYNLQPNVAFAETTISETTQQSVSSEEQNQDTSDQSQNITQDSSDSFWAVDEINNWSSKQGISNATELVAFMKQVNSGTTFSDKTIYLDSNIDLSGKIWTPIGTSTNKFKGTFDGNGHTITGLRINSTAKYTYNGLFGCAENAIIRNVTLIGVDINVNIAYPTGALLAHGVGVKIINCGSTGSVTNISTNTGSYTGGLVGYCKSSSLITRSFSYATVSGYDAGGLVSNAYQSTISQCFSAGDHIGKATSVTDIYTINGTAIQTNASNWITDTKGVMHGNTSKKVLKGVGNVYISVNKYSVNFSGEYGTEGSGDYTISESINAKSYLINAITKEGTWPTNSTWSNGGLSPDANYNYPYVSLTRNVVDKDADKLFSSTNFNSSATVAATFDASKLSYFTTAHTLNIYNESKSASSYYPGLTVGSNYNAYFPTQLSSSYTLDIFQRGILKEVTVNFKEYKDVIKSDWVDVNTSTNITSFGTYEEVFSDYNLTIEEPNTALGRTAGVNRTFYIPYNEAYSIVFNGSSSYFNKATEIGTSSSLGTIRTILDPFYNAKNLPSEGCKYVYGPIQEKTSTTYYFNNLQEVTLDLNKDSYTQCLSENTPYFVNSSFKGTTDPVKILVMINKNLSSVGIGHIINSSTIKKYMSYAIYSVQDDSFYPYWAKYKITNFSYNNVKYITSDTSNADTVSLSLANQIWNVLNTQNVTMLANWTNVTETLNSDVILTISDNKSETITGTALNNYIQIIKDASPVIKNTKDASYSSLFSTFTTYTNKGVEMSIQAVAGYEIYGARLTFANTEQDSIDLKTSQDFNYYIKTKKENTTLVKNAIQLTTSNNLVSIKFNHMIGISKISFLLKPVEYDLKIGSDIDSIVHGNEGPLKIYATTEDGNNIESFVSKSNPKTLIHKYRIATSFQIEVMDGYYLQDSCFEVKFLDDYGNEIKKANFDPVTLYTISKNLSNNKYEITFNTKNMDYDVDSIQLTIITSRNRGTVDYYLNGIDSKHIQGQDIIDLYKTYNNVNTEGAVAEDNLTASINVNTDDVVTFILNLNSIDYVAVGNITFSVAGETVFEEDVENSNKRYTIVIEDLCLEDNDLIVVEIEIIPVTATIEIYEKYVGRETTQTEDPVISSTLSYGAIMSMNSNSYALNFNDINNDDLDFSYTVKSNNVYVSADIYVDGLLVHSIADIKKPTGFISNLTIENEDVIEVIVQYNYGKTKLYIKDVLFNNSGSFINKTQISNNEFTVDSKSYKSGSLVYYDETVSITANNSNMSVGYAYDGWYVIGDSSEFTPTTDIFNKLGATSTSISFKVIDYSTDFITACIVYNANVYQLNFDEYVYDNVNDKDLDTELSHSKNVGWEYDTATFSNELPTLIISGMYNFKGWTTTNLSDNKTLEYDYITQLWQQEMPVLNFTKEVTSINLSPIIEPKTVTYYFRINGEVDGDYGTVTYGDTNYSNKKVAPDIVGYTFKGWAYQNDLYLAYESKKWTVAEWKVEEVEVFFDAVYEGEVVNITFTAGVGTFNTGVSSYAGTVTYGLKDYASEALKITPTYTIQDGTATFEYAGYYNAYYGGKEYRVYNDGSNNSTCDFKESIEFVAVYELTDFTATLDTDKGTSWVYDGKQYEILIDLPSVDEGILGYEYVWEGTNNSNFVKNVKDSGKYTCTITASGISTMHIIGSATYTAEIEITITQRELKFTQDGKETLNITKVFDNKTSAPNNVAFTNAVAGEGITMTAEYEDKNVGTNKKMIVQISSSINNVDLNNYTYSSDLKGEITAYKLTFVVNGSVYKVGDSSLKISINNDCISYSTTTSTFLGSIGASASIGLSTNKNEVGTYTFNSQLDKQILVNENSFVLTNADVSNFEYEITGSFEIKTTDTNAIQVSITVVCEDGGNENLKNISSISLISPSTEQVTGNNTNQVIIVESKTFLKNAWIKANINFKNSYYWIQKVEVDGTESNIVTNNQISYQITNNSVDSIEIVVYITTLKIITFNYALSSGESVELSTTTKFAYQQKISTSITTYGAILPDANEIKRTGWTFDYWRIANTTTKVTTDTVWSYNDATLEAVYKLADITVDQLIDGTKQESILTNYSTIFDNQNHTVEYDITNKNTNSISYSYKWQKSVNGSTTNLSNTTNYVNFKNVTDSATYKITITIQDKINSVNKKTFTYSINVIISPYQLFRNGQIITKVYDKLTRTYDETTNSKDIEITANEVDIIIRGKYIASSVNSTLDRVPSSWTINGKTATKSLDTNDDGVIDVVYSADENYSLDFNVLDYKNSIITPKSITIIDSATKDYDGKILTKSGSFNDSYTPFTYKISTNSHVIGIYNQESSNISITITGDDINNFEITVQGDFEITKLQVSSFNWQGATELTFDGVYHKLTPVLPSAIKILTITYQSETETLTYNYSNNVGAKNAGVYTVTFTYEANDNYDDLQNTSATLTINKRVVYVNYSGVIYQKDYDGTVDVKENLSPNVWNEPNTTLLNTIIPAGEMPVFNYEFENANACDPTATKSIIVSLSDETNYILNTDYNKLTGRINRLKRDVYVNAQKYYDEKDNFVVDSTNIRIDNLVNKEIVTGSVTFLNVKSAGTYYNLQTLSNDNNLYIGGLAYNVNYELSFINSTTTAQKEINKLVILKANIIVATNAKQQYTYTGIEVDINYGITRSDGENSVPSSLGITYTPIGDAQLDGSKAVQVGRYYLSFELTGDDLNNYQFDSTTKYNNIEFEIIKREIFITFENNVVFTFEEGVVPTHAGTDDSIISSTTTLGEGDTISWSFTPVRGDVGYYYISNDSEVTKANYFYKNGVDYSKNYKITYDYKSCIIINRRVIDYKDIERLATSVEYNGQVQKIQVKLFNVVYEYGVETEYATFKNVKRNNSLAGVTDINSASDIKYEGLYTYNLEFKNYLINNNSTFEFVITPKLLTVEITQLDKEYDGTNRVDPNNIVTTGIVEGDNISIVGYYSQKDASVSALKITLELNCISQLLKSSYKLENINYTGFINPKEIEFSLIKKYSVYYTNSYVKINLVEFLINNVNTTDNSGLVNQESMQGTITLNKTKAGSYDLADNTVIKGVDIAFDLTAKTYNGDSTSVENYSFNYQSLSGIVEILPAHLSYTVSDNVKIYNAQKQEPTFSFSYLVDGNQVQVQDDTIKVKYFVVADSTSQQYSPINAGYYYIYLYTEEGSNYTFVNTSNTPVGGIFVNTILEIQNRAINVNVEKYVHSYDGNVAVYNATNADTKDPTNGSGGLIDGHSFNAKLVTNSHYAGRYQVIGLSFSGDLDKDKQQGVYPESASITQNGENVIANYTITYNVCIFIVSDIQNLDSSSIQNVTYTSTNIIEEDFFKVSFEFNTIEQNKHEIVYNKSYSFGNGYTALLTDLCIYKMQDDGSFAYTTTSQAVDVGVYRVTLKITNSIDPTLAISNKVITFNIIKKAIKTITGSFDKYYDGTSEVVGELSSTDIFEVDQNYVTIKGYYKLNGSNMFVVGSYTIEFTLIGQKSNNYYIDVSNQNGKINKQPLNLKLKNDMFIYYSGNEYNIALSNFDSYKNDTNTIINNILTNLSGYITVKEINAGMYTLTQLYNSLSLKAVIEDNSKILSNYEIVAYTGNFQIKPCELEINITNDNVIYNAKQQSVTYNVSAKNGTINDSEKDLLLDVLYDNSKTLPTNAKIYNLTFKVSAVCSNNYVINHNSQNVSSADLGTFEIKQREIKIQMPLDYETPYTGNKAVYELSVANIYASDIAESGLVKGHLIEGYFETSDIGIGVYEYNGTQLTLNLKDFTILEGTTGVTSNYNVIGVIASIKIVNAVSEKIDSEHINSLIYCAEDFVQKGEIYIYIGINGQNIQFMLNESNYLGTLTGLVNSDNESVTEVIDAGTYKMYLTINESTVVNREIEFTIAKKSIQHITFTADKYYDRSSNVVGEISSIDIYDVDKQQCIITGVYVNESQNPVANTGEYDIIFTLSGVKASNYELDLEPNKGNIFARKVTLQLKQNYSTYYTNNKIEIEKDLFVAKSDDGTTISDFITNTKGSVVVDLLEVNTYDLHNNLTYVDFSKILSSDSNPNYLNNYSILDIQGSLTIEKAQISVTVSDYQKIYNGMVQGATFTEKVYDNRGLLVATTSILEITYNKDGQAKESNVIDAGEYFINITIADDYTDCYTLYFNGVKDEYVATEKLVISKKQVKIEVDQVQTYSYTGQKIVYQLVNENVKDIISGQNVEGSLTTNGYRGGIYQLDNVAYSSDFSKLDITPSIKITNSNADVTSNYEITTVTATIQIVSKLGENFDVSKLQNLVYDKTDKLANKLIVVSLQIDDQVKQFVYTNTYTECTFGSLTYNGSSATEVINVGEYKFNIHILVNGAEKEEEITFNVVPKTISVVSYTSDKTYDATANLIGDVTSSHVISGDKVSFVTSYADKNVGQHSINISLDGDDSYNYVLDNALKLSGEIKPREITLQVSNSAKIYYDGYEAEIYVKDLSISSGTLVLGQVLDGYIVLLKTAAGEYDFLLENLSLDYFAIYHNDDNVTSNYKITFTGKVNILTLLVKIDVDSENINLLVYNGNVHDIKPYLTVNVAENLLQEAQNAVNISYDQRPIDAGSYNATISSISNNFTFEVNNYTNNIVDFIINKRDIQINIDEVKVNYNPTSDYTTEFTNNNFINIVENQVVQGVYKLDQAGLDIGVYSFTSSPNKIIVQDLKIIVNGVDILTKNYNLNPVMIGTLEILPHNLDISKISFKDNNQYIYDATDVRDYIVVSYIDPNGIQKDITYTDKTFGEFIISQAENKDIEAINAGEYTLELTIYNYHINSNTFPLVISQREVSDIIFNKNKNYNGNSYVYNRNNLTKLLSNDIILKDFSYIEINGNYVDANGVPTSNAGEHNIVFSFVNPDSLPQKNYKIIATSKGVISPIDVIIKAEHTFAYLSTGVYTLNNTDYTYTGLINGHLLDGELTITKAEYLGELDITAFSTQYITIVDEYQQDVKQNYNIALTGTINVVKAKIAISFEGVQNTYVYEKKAKVIEPSSIVITNSTEQVLPSFSILYTGEGYSSENAPINVGDYTITYSINSPYYEIESGESFDFSITTFEFVIQTGDIPSDKFYKLYAEQDPELKMQFVTVYEDTITTTFTREQGESIGTYDIYVNTYDNKNYTVVFAEGANADLFRIKKAGTITITITSSQENINALQKVYDNQNIEIVDISTLTYEANDEVITGTLKFEEGVNVGEYNLESWELENENYENVKVICELTYKIVQKDIKIDVQNANKAYDASTKFLGSLSILDEQDNVLTSNYPLTVEAQYEQSDVADSIKLILTFNNDLITNYNVINEVYGNITQRNIIVTPDSNQSIVYGTTEYSISYTVQDNEVTEYYGDLLQEISGDLYIEYKQGYNKFIAEKYDILSNLTSNNLSITFVNGVQFEIEQKQLSVTNSTNYNKVYDGNNNVIGTFEIEGIITGDVVTVSAVYNNELVGENKTITFILDGVDAQNYFVLDVLGEITEKSVILNYIYNSDENMINENRIENNSKLFDTLIYNKKISDSIGSLPLPTHEGYTFNGWFMDQQFTQEITGNTVITSPVWGINEDEKTIYAKWTIKTFSLKVEVVTRIAGVYTIDNSGGTHSNIDGNYNYYSTINLQNLAQSNTGYEFIGYSLDITLGVDQSLISNGLLIEAKEHTLYAKFNPLMVTLTLKSNGGTFIKSGAWQFDSLNQTATTSVEYATVLGTDLPVAERVGYTQTVGKWSDGNNVFDIDKDTIIGDIYYPEKTLYVVWSANTYVITLDANGGYFEEYSQDWTPTLDANSKAIQISKSVVFGSKIGEIEYPVRPGYTFDSWTKTITEDTIWDTIDTTPINANWIENSYNVTISTEYGSVEINIYDTNNTLLSNKNVANGNITISVYSTNILNISVNDDPGYTFTNWTSNKLEINNSSQTQLQCTTFIQDVSITANFVANDNNIKIIVNDMQMGYAMVGQYTTIESGTFTVVAKTGTTVDISTIAYEGYEIYAWEVAGQQDLDLDYHLSGVNTNTNRTLSKFVSDLTITVIFTTKVNTITVKSESVKGTITAGESSGLITYDFKVKTREILEFAVNALHGYKVDTTLSSWKFETTSLNKGTFEVSGDGYTANIKFTGFTFDGVINIPFVKDTFTVTLVSVTKDITYITEDNLTNIVTLSQNNSQTYIDSNGNFTGEYESVVKLTPNDVIVGYQFKAWSLENNKEISLSTLNGLVSSGENGEIEYRIVDDITLYLIYEIETYEVTFSVNDEVRGMLTRDGHIQQKFTLLVKYGYDSSFVTAINEDYYQFVEWVIVENDTETFYSNERTINAVKVTKNIEYVAKFEGIPISIQVQLILPSSEIYVTGEIDFGSIIVDTNNNTSVSLPTKNEVYTQDNVLDYLSLTYTISSVTGETIVFNIAESEGYKFDTHNLEPRLQFSFDEANLKYSLIDVYLETTIKIKMQARENVVSFNVVGKPSGADIFEDINNRNGVTRIEYTNNGKTLLVYVKTGGNAYGLLYTYVGYKLAPNNIFKETSQTLANGEYDAFYYGGVDNVVEDKEITIEILPLVYSITFNLNDDLVNPTTTTSVVRFGETLFNPTLSDTFTSPARYKYIFKGYNTSDVYYASTYYFDGNGIYRIVENDGIQRKIYGFTGSEHLVESTQDGIDFECTLYAQWQLETHYLNIEFVPDFAVESPLNWSDVVPEPVGRHFESLNDVVVGVKYEPGSIMTVIAPLLSENYSYFGWSYEPNITDYTLLNDNYYTGVMDQEDITIYLYYAIKVSAESLGGGEVSISEEYVLYNSTVELTAVSEFGYDFAYWIANSTPIENSIDTMEVTVIGPTIYYGKFLGKQVNVILEQVDKAKIRIAGSTAEEENVYRVGDTIYLEIYDLVYGYYQAAWGGEYSGLIDNNTYTLLPEDGTRTFVKFKPNIAATTVKVQFLIDKNTGGEFNYNNNKVTFYEVNYLYDSEINFELITRTRYGLVALTINDNPLDLSTTSIIINEQQGFDITIPNLIKATFEQLLWIDVWEMFSGRGTENDPYVILNENQLAAMAYLINNNVDAQGVPYAQGYYLVKRDMNLGARFWQPIGTEEHPFDGTFNLQDNNVIELLLDKEYEVTHLGGLFGYITDNAKFLTGPGNFSITTIIIASVVSFIIILILLIILFIILKRKKMKKLSNSTTIDQETYAMMNQNDD